MSTKEVSSKRAKDELEKGYKNAQETLENRDKLEDLLQRLEHKLKVVPKIGEKLSHVPVFASMLKSYLKKEYVKAPMGTMIAIVSALAYFVLPVDLIPDFIPGVGYIDEAAVVGACLALVDSDVREYMEWRNANGKIIKD